MKGKHTFFFQDMAKVLETVLGFVPDERQGDDVVGVNGDEPIAVLAVRVRQREIWGEDESRRSRDVPAAWG